MSRMPAFRSLFQAVCLGWLCTSHLSACTGSSGAGSGGNSSGTSGGALGSGSGSGNSGGFSGSGGSPGLSGGTNSTAGSSSGGLAAGGSSSLGGAVNGGVLNAGGISNGGASRGGGSSGGASSGTSGGVFNGGGPSAGGSSGGTSSGGKAAAGASSAGASNGGNASGGTSSTSGGAGTVTTGGKPASVTPASGATLVKPNPATKRQKFEGWGTSLAWWANRIGGWSADKRNQFLELIVNPSTGLGYNIFRYNIGGGENPAHTHMGQYKDMPGFQPTQGNWNWNADARQVAVLSRLVASGQNVIVEAFSNSPPYWMTKSGCASGSSDGSNNLKDDAYDLFASYLTDVTKHFRDELGITFRTLEPLNEPNANWWKSNGGQEGCHFAASNQQQIIKAVGAQLASKGLSETRVSASDENSMDDAYTIMNGYDATTLGYIVQMNTHSYAGSRRTQLRSLATSKGKRLWQSESGPLSVTLANNTEAALFMAGRIITDLRDLQPEAWIDWQVVDTATAWTSFSINDSQQTGAPLKRFYMHAGFSRYIRPGATFIDINNVDMVAALAADGASLTIVARNGDTSAKSFTFDLTGLATVGTRVTAYRTSASEDLVSLPAISVQNWAFTASCPASSVTTFVVPFSAAP